MIILTYGSTVLNLTFLAIMALYYTALRKLWGFEGIDQVLHEWHPRKNNSWWVIERDLGLHFEYPKVLIREFWEIPSVWFTFYILHKSNPYVSKLHDEDMLIAFIRMHCTPSNERRSTGLNYNDKYVLLLFLLSTPKVSHATQLILWVEN